MTFNMPIKRTIHIKDENDTLAFGMNLGKNLECGDVLALIGDLGTGKTALTRYMAQGLGVTDRVNSPTFTIVKEYYTGRIPLYHFDVYRVADSNEIIDIGGEEYFYGNGVCVVEWADLILDILPENTKYIYIEFGDAESERVYRCTF